MATINDLSDDTLCEIFSYIGVIERQRLEIVSKRWRKLIRVLWRKITKLSFDYYDGTDPLEVRKSYSNGLDFAYGELSDIGSLLEICEKNLTELIIYNKGPDNDETDAFMPLSNCKNLKHFSIDTYDNTLINDFLKYVSTESLEKLEVNNIEYEFTENIYDIIVEILKEAEHLTSLDLGGVSSVVLQAIGEKSQLKCLCIGNMNQSMETEDLFLDFTNLGNLEDLTIHEERMVDDKLLIDVAENCKKLRRINLWSENSISAGLKAVGQLPNLRIVDLMELDESDVLNCFSNLEEFYFDLVYQEALNTGALKEFLKRSPNLKKYYFKQDIYHKMFDEIAKELGMDIKCEKRR